MGKINKIYGIERNTLNTTKISVILSLIFINLIYSLKSL